MTALKPHAFHILVALSEGDGHGSGIQRRVRELTDGDVQLWPVTLYRTLDELVDAGLIAELESPEDRPEGASRRRRYYRLTDEGAAAVDEEARRLEEIARTVRRNVETGSWR